MTHKAHKKKKIHLLQRWLQRRTSAPAPMAVGNPQKQDIDLLPPRSILSTGPCGKLSDAESRTALAIMCNRGPGALILLLTQLASRTSAKYSASISRSKGCPMHLCLDQNVPREGRGRAGCLRFDGERTSNPPNMKWFSRSGKACEI